jgi:hypothetical protein
MIITNDTKLKIREIFLKAALESNSIVTVPPSLKLPKITEKEARELAISWPFSSSEIYNWF